MPFSQVELVIDHKVRGMCGWAYADHPRGCPNLEKQKEGCPPKAPLIEKQLILSDPTYVIWSSFDLAAQVEKLRKIHPDWSDRKLECCLYWQPRARTVLDEEVRLFLKQYPGKLVILCPEATGVVVTPTMAKVGVTLQWPPKTVTYQVAVAGTPAVRKEPSSLEQLLDSLPDESG